MKLHRLLQIVAPLLLLSGCGPGGKTPDANAGVSPTQPVGLKDLETTDVKVGKGPVAAKGDLVVVKYEGKLKDGTVFDSSQQGGFPMAIGESPVIEGWQKGLVGMKEGGERKLSIPYRMAYGEKGQGKIPPRSDLFFDITLLGLVKAGQQDVIVPTEVKPGSGKPVDAGDTVTIHTKTRLIDGTLVFDSRKKKKAQTFTIGAEEAWPHVDVGVRGMRPGGIRSLRVPPGAAWGPQAASRTIPGNMILLYEIELLSAKYKK